jgi:hypothetical protein
MSSPPAESSRAPRAVFFRGFEYVDTIQAADLFLLDALEREGFSLLPSFYPNSNHPVQPFVNKSVPSDPEANKIFLSFISPLCAAGDLPDLLLTKANPTPDIECEQQLPVQNICEQIGHI